MELTVKIKMLKDRAKVEYQKWGLTGWAFKLGNSLKILGTCYYEKRKIIVSKQFLATLPFEESVDTLLHEIAHALQYIEMGYTNHDDHWKEYARKVGAKPERVAKLSVNNVPQPKYIAVCEDHGIVDRFSRMGTNWKLGLYVCAKCHGKLEVKNNPKYQ